MVVEWVKDEVVGSVNDVRELAILERKGHVSMHYEVVLSID